MSIDIQYPSGPYGDKEFKFATPTEPPVVKRVSANKSRTGTHLTTIRDQGECGPVIECLVEYEAKHCLPLGTIEIEVGNVIDVMAVYVESVGYGERSVIQQQDRHYIHPAYKWIDSSNVILNENSGLQDRIVKEIEAKLAAE